MSLHDVVIQTEFSIRAVEQCVPPAAVAQEWTMWLDLSTIKCTFSEKELHFELVENVADWEAMRQLRQEIEAALGRTDGNLVDALINDIRCKVAFLDGEWFLAWHAGTCVGQIGLIPFDFEGRRFMRLQNVDIHPYYQGQRLGGKLLRWAVFQIQQRGFEAACLMAKADDWPKEWYQRIGFRKVGET